MKKNIILFGKLRIAYKILLLVLTACLLCCVVLGIFVYHTLKNAIDEKVDIQYISKLREARVNTVSFIESAHHELIFFTSIPDLYNLSKYVHTHSNSHSSSECLEWKAHLEKIFREKLLSYPNYSQIRLIDDTGMECIRVDNTGDQIKIIPINELQNISHRYYFTEIMKLNNREIYISPLDLNREYSEIQVPYAPTIRLGTPIIIDGKKLGALIIYINAGKLLSNIESLFTLSKYSNLFLINSEGFYMNNVLHPEFEWGDSVNLNTGYNFTDDYNVELFQKLYSNEQSTIHYKNRFIYYTLFRIGNYRTDILGIDVPESYIFSSLYNFRYFSIVFIIVLLIVIFIISFTFTKNITRPISELRMGMEKIAKGNYNFTLPVHSSDEIGNLTKDFNNMNENLKRKSEKLIQLFELGITTQKESKDIIKLVINIIIKIIPIEMCAIGKITGDNKLQFISFFDKGRWTYDKTISIDKNPCINTILKREYHYIKNAFEEFKESELIQENTIYTLLGVPILSSKADVIGVILLLDKRKLDIAHEDIELLYTLSRRVSFEIEQEEMSREVTKKEGEIDYLSKYVPLTDLPNANLFKEKLQHIIKQAAQIKNIIGLLKIDIFNYRTISLSHGVGTTDALIQRVAQILTKHINEFDLIGQTGQSEFTIALTQIKNKEFITTILFQIIDIFKNSLRIKDKEIFIRLKIGVSLYPSDARNLLKLINCADLALSSAQDQVQTQYAFYSKDLDDYVSERIELENALVNGLEENKFQIFYQPQVNSRTGQVIGSEALLRFHDKKLGNVSPIKFIPILEQTELIFSVGEWVLETACKQNKILQDQGYVNLKIAVNISSLQFKRNDFMDVIHRIVEKTGLDPHTLEIEITEGIIVEDIRTVNAKLNQIKKLGIRIAIDDFGTGYSSLRYLKIFSIDKLKIDRSFIKDIPEKDDGSIATTIIELSKNFGMDVIAEGAETDEQIAFLQEKGCDLIQGFYYSQPVSFDKYAEFLKKMC